MTLSLFGTDGIRAHCSAPILQPSAVLRLGCVLADLAKRQLFGHHTAMKPHVVIGRDTRVHGPYLEHALISGFLSSGIDVQVLGVIPTAAVAHVTKISHAALGIMISASHNPHHDNGFKVFDVDGFKITEAQERHIEHDFFSDRTYAIARSPGALASHLDPRVHIRALINKIFSSPLDLSSLRIVIDSAHGAASHLAHDIFESFGATVISIADFAEGKAINLHCGSEAPEHIKDAVIRERAHLGIAFDGDADRVIFVDETGAHIEGDGILAACAIALKNEGHLAKDTVVATVMSSVALDNALSPHGINVVRTAVGDKFVAREMKANGYTFGGENSGHLILFPYATTGDGILSALLFVSIVQKIGMPVSRFMEFFKPYPRLLKNIVIDEKIPLHELPKTQDAINKMNGHLQATGRVMLRYSGTENKVRLLVEAPTDQDCERIARDILDAFQTEVACVRNRA